MKLYKLTPLIVLAYISINNSFAASSLTGFCKRGFATPATTWKSHDNTGKEILGERFDPSRNECDERLTAYPNPRFGANNVGRVLPIGKIWCQLPSTHDGLGRAWDKNKYVCGDSTGWKAVPIE